MVVGIVGTNAALGANGPFTASYLAGRAAVWAKLTAICAYSTAWAHCKVGKSQHNGRKGYLSLRDPYLGPNNVDLMASASEKILQNAVYHGEQNNNTFERCVRIQKAQHTILENLEEHGYKGIDERSNFWYLIEGIKPGALNAVNATILTSAPYCQYYDASLIIYKDYINQAQDTNVELNI